ncbi:sugar phosphate isomerase/epimerase [Burkholderia sp. Bp9143]|uniref:sugar phosphate isomerase/epimerase family protein n=1 Tax=Burkholderia sp. Bp9143 TaxID=2184574 RepID=UPI000F59B0C9|nr:sugar phosphate isomerase/epimerase [Burkholderia sp. Bp9143]RQR31427.1 sugar phosphate isomerase/epimerase [Burkholderia sp. Bp9143]
MKIGLVSDSLSHLSLEDLLQAAQETGIEGVEINTGNWSSAPHVDLDGLLVSSDKRRAFLDALDSRDLSLIALNCNGNQLHPTDGARQSAVIRNTIRLAAELGLDKVCLMSGLPGGAPGDRTPNWIVSSWPPETQQVLDWQWNEVLLPYWSALVKFASEQGINKLCIELHGNQLVYNVPTLLKLRAAVGPIVGANLDPSHLMWMGADPLEAVDALGDAIYHVHAKDTRINAARCATTGLLENGPLDNIAARAWSYITLGYGRPEAWWKDFCYRLRVNGYDGWLSIEHEDVLMSRIEGVRRSVALLKSAAPVDVADFAPQPI